MTSTTRIINKLNEAYVRLEQANHDVAVLDEEYMCLENDYERAYDRAFLTESGPVEVRKTQARYDNADLKLNMRLAEARVRAGRDHVRMLGMQIEILRSMNAAAQREFMAEPIGQYT
jgi:hypothetical protein